MASRRIPSLLALEVESADRPPADRQIDSGVDPPHLDREPTVGRSSNSIGTAPTWVQCDGKDRGEISGETCPFGRMANGKSERWRTKTNMRIIWMTCAPDGKRSDTYGQRGPQRNRWKCDFQSSGASENASRQFQNHPGGRLTGHMLQTCPVKR